LSRLLSTPLPQSDESLMGYIVRLTEVNGYSTPSWIFDLAGLKVDIHAGGWATLYQSWPDFSCLEKLMGLEHHEFERLRFKMLDSYQSISFLGLPINKEYIRNESPKVCPACLKESNHYRYIWDLIPFTACPKHSVVLIDICPSCNKRLSWARGRNSICRCGIDWRDSELLQVDYNELKLPELLCSLYGITEHHRFSSDEKENQLNKLDLADLLQVLSIPAKYYLLIAKGHRLNTTTTNAACHLAYNNALTVFEDWPENYFRYLDWLEQHGGETVISDFYKCVLKQCGKASLFFFMASLEEYIDRMEEMIESPSYLPFIMQRLFIKKSEACLRLALQEEWLDILIAQGKIEGYRKNNKAELLIYAPSVKILKSDMSELVTVWSAGEFLGIAAGDVMELIYNGYLKPCSGPDIDGLRDWAVKPSDLCALIRKIEGKVIRSGLSRKGSLLAAADVFKYLRQYELSVGKFVCDILNDEITPVGVLQTEGLVRFLFQKSQVVSYRKKRYPEDIQSDLLKPIKKHSRKRVLGQVMSGTQSENIKSKIPEGILRHIITFLCEKWEQKDSTFPSKHVQAFTTAELAEAAKRIFVEDSFYRWE
jgi:hypothetical protein